MLTLVVAVASLITSTVSVGAVILTAWINKRSEDRRHLRSLLVNAAIEEWKYQFEAYKVHKQPVTIPPLDAHIIRMLKFADIVTSENLSGDETIAKLKEIDVVTSSVMDYKLEKQQRGKTERA